MNYIIKSEYAGKTVKEFLKNEVKPSNKLLALLKNRDNGILVNHRRVTVRHILSSGDVLSLNYEDDNNRENINIVPNDSLLKSIDIIYEDDYMIAVDKPYGMPSHPSLNHFDDTLANAVTAYFKNKNQVINFRSVNRLDKNTSGIVLIAKNKMISAKLNDLIKTGNIKKIYKAIITGNIDCCEQEKINNDLKTVGGLFCYDKNTKTGQITAPIKREKESIIKRICSADGDSSKTDFQVLRISEDKKLCYLEIYPLTGRTHQIRVHFHSIGYPLLGDDLYFIEGATVYKNNIIKRHALHASSIEFVHPMTRDNINISCELCEDMKLGFLY